MKLNELLKITGNYHSKESDNLIYVGSNFPLDKRYRNLEDYEISSAFGNSIYLRPKQAINSI